MEKAIGHGPGELRKNSKDSDTSKVNQQLLRRLIAKTEEVEAK
jgi:hypothetical protein